jgi:hypothetical protein
VSLVKVTWNDREVKAALKRMRHHRGSFAPVFKDLKKPWREDLKAHASRERGPDGKWPKLAASTSGRYEHRSSQRKRLTGGRSGPVQKKLIRRRSRKLLGKLPSAVTFRAKAGSIMGVSKVPWSEIMNEGGRVGRGAVLPKREFLFVSPAFQKLAGQKMAEYVVKEWGR